MLIKDSIEQKLKSLFSPELLEVINESNQHNVPQGSETHFKIVIVSHQFIDKTLVNRHRAVYQALSEYLQNPIHALALHTFTAQEWHQNSQARSSPQCLGGSKV